MQTTIFATDSLEPAVKVTYAMNVLNGEPFIKYQLDSIYRYAHEILIVEGAYEKFKHAAKGYHSYDRTLDIIQSFPDPRNKIKLIVNDKFYSDRLEMCNQFMQHITGDILWQIDVDEFYRDETHEYIRDQFRQNDCLDLVTFNFCDYYKSFDHVINGYNDNLTSVRRVFRVVRGMKWINQRPPTLAVDGIPIFAREELSSSVLCEMDHLMHNATMLFDEQVSDKFNYYNQMWPKTIFSIRNFWYQQSWKEFKLKFCISGFTNQITYAVKRVHRLPKVLLELKNDLSLDLHSKYNINPSFVAQEIHKDQYYELKVRISIIANGIDKIPLVSLPKSLFQIFILGRKIPTDIDKKFIHHVLRLKVAGKLKKIFRQPFYQLNLSP